MSSGNMCFYARTQNNNMFQPGLYPIVLKSKSKCKHKAQAFVGSFRRIELAIPDQKTSFLVLIDVNSPLHLFCG